jgi:ATP-dependent protease ClpP protease subunit
MCHQFSSSTDAKYHDIKAEMKENEQLNNKMIAILKDSTGMAPSVIKKKLLPPSDVYLTAEEVLDLNIADHIL